MKLLVGACVATVMSAGVLGGDLERMSYNNDGTSFLGVGLWAWPVPMDWDGDGDLDLVVSCPCTPYNGTWFFENPGVNNKDPMPVFKKGVQVGKGYFNLASSIVDGKSVVTRPGTANWNPSAGWDAATPLKGLKSNVHYTKVRGNVWRLADYDGDGREDVLVGVEDYVTYGWANAYDATGVWTNGWIRGRVYVCRNVKGRGPDAEYAPAELVPTTVGIPLETFGNPMPMLADWDGDGDLDLLCGSFMDDFTYFANVGTRTAPRYAPGRKLNDGDGRELKLDLEMITPTAIDWDRDGDLDIICGDEDGRVAFIENTGALKDGQPVFKRPRYFRQQMDDLFFGALSTPVAVDWDGDGDEDIITGSSAGYVAFIENLSGKGVARPTWAEPKLMSFTGSDWRIPQTADGIVTAQPIRFMAGVNGSIQGPCEEKWGYTVLTVADWDGDGFLDIMCNGITGDVVWFRNPGKKGTLAFEPPRPVEVEWDGAQPAQKWGWRKPQGKALLTQWRTTPVMFDWTGDGLVDLVMLDQEGYLCLFERAKVDGKMVLKAPRRVFCWKDGKPMRLNSGTAGASGRRKICIADWDGDGRPDLLLNGRNADFVRQVDAKDGMWFFENKGPLAKRALAGHTSCPCTCDFNGNGIPELLVGAEDGFFYWMERDAVEPRANAPIRNPLFDGWYADPQIRLFGDTYWIFPTYSHEFKDQLFLDVFSSKDLRTWTKHPKAVEAKNFSWVRGAMWAPDAHENNGKYYVFFGANDAYPVGGKRSDGPAQTEPGLAKYGGIGVAVADHPEGPYRDLIGRPLIDQFWNKAQPIDQYVFKYKGDWYMIYGGWGRCNLVRLAPDFTSLVPFEDGRMWKDFTPKGYVEGSVMFERKGRWYFMYSSGGWVNDTYCVNYSVGDSPFGPFEFKGRILGTQRPIATGAGHNSVINVPGTDEWYICYHRRPIPPQGRDHRVTCLDRLRFDEKGDILPVVMTAESNAGITVFNQDSTNFTMTHEDAQMNAQGLKDYLNSVIGGGKITHFFICPNAQTALFDTKTLSPSWWRKDDSTVEWHDAPRRDYMLFTNGVDVVQLYIDGCRAKGVSPWISMRMNDDHCPNEPKWWGHSKFWVDHPEFRLKGRSCFDYRHPEVRDYHLAFVKEVLERYDVDGFECDWMRFPSAQSKEALTAFMRAARELTDAAAKRRGHPVLMGVRIDSRPERMAGHGTDVLAWVKEGLTDWVVPCNFFMSADMELPIAEWRRLVSEINPAVKVIPGIDSGVKTRAMNGGRRMLTAAEYRGWADRMFKGGAEGVYLFNLFTFNEVKSYKIVSKEPWDFILKEGLSPASIENRSKSIPADWIRE